MSLKSGCIWFCAMTVAGPTLACQAAHSSSVVRPYRITPPDMLLQLTRSRPTSRQPIRHRARS